jgi:murein DD-endopeptidase MepM/ murein hydrolase activator NlpD
MLKDMGRLKIRDSFTNFLKDWRSGVFTLILVLAFFFNLIISENEHAEAGHAATPTKDIQAVVPEPQATAVIRTNRETELARGSNLMYHLESEGISRSDSNAVIAVLQDVVDLRSLRAGQAVTLHYENNYFEGLTLPLSIDKDIRVGRSGSEGFRVTEHFKDLQTYPVTKETTVESSLYGSALNSGIEDNIIMELIQLYSFDVDFQRDIQKGDVLKVCYEKIYDESGDALDTGNILYTTLQTGERNLEIFRYVDTAGKTDYYNRSGHTVRKTLLKTPINGAYITSSFGRRTHRATTPFTRAWTSGPPGEPPSRPPVTER